MIYYRKFGGCNGLGVDIIITGETQATRGFVESGSWYSKSENKGGL